MQEGCSTPWKLKKLFSIMTFEKLFQQTRTSFSELGSEAFRCHICYIIFVTRTTKKERNVKWNQQSQRFFTSSKNFLFFDQNVFFEISFSCFNAGPGWFVPQKIFQSSIFFIFWETICFLVIVYQKNFEVQIFTHFSYFLLFFLFFF